MLFKAEEGIINPEISVQNELFDNIDCVITYYKLDTYGKVMFDNITNSPIIYNINKE